MSPLQIERNFSNSVGAVSSGSRDATKSAIDILQNGGNAADAAVACAFSLMVTDPANASPAGRCQILFGDWNNLPLAIDGTTVSPARFQKSKGQKPIPIPGVVSALISFHKSYGQLPLPNVVEPAIKLALSGFMVAREQAAIWSWRQPELTGTSLEGLFLPNGNAPKEGKIFYNPNLAGFLSLIKTSERDPFRDPNFVRPLLHRMQEKGLSWTLPEAVLDQTIAGQVISRDFADFTVFTAGRQGWGHTLIDILDKYFRNPWVEVLNSEMKLALCIFLGVTGRQSASQNKIEESYWSDIENDKKVKFEINREVLHSLARAQEECRSMPGDAEEDRDTTALAVCDVNGSFVSITQSIGPHFGSRVLDEKTGIIFAHSYQMDRHFMPSQRDITELCPTIIKIGSKMFALGAAGSERIPGAVATVIRNLVEGKSLMDAVSMPRSNYSTNGLRVHKDLSPNFDEFRRAISLEPCFADRGPINHLGIVHAVGSSLNGQFEASADPAYSGAGQIGKNN